MSPASDTEPDGRSESELRNELDSIGEQAYSCKEKIRGVIARIKEARVALDGQRKTRDELNAKVKQMIEAGKGHQRKADEIAERIEQLKARRRDVRGLVKERAQLIQLTKEQRDQLNRLAAGTVDRLFAQLQESLRILLTTDLSLKNEIILVEIVFDLIEKLKVKLEAEEVHKAVQETYKDLKEKESEAGQLFDEIGGLIASYECEYQHAMEAFQQKDKVRSEADAAHRQVVATLEQIKEMENQIKDIEKTIEGLRKSRDDIVREIRESHIRKARMEEERKVSDAKKKAEGKGRLSLEELGLLMKKGEIKVRKDER